MRSSALIRPAAAMIAVPCWSSWNTGMVISSRRRCSMMKHSGALMSSRLMPPKVGPSRRTQLTNSSTSVRVDLEVDAVDVGEALEQDRLALHHRLGGEGAQVAQAQDGGAVGDHGHQVAAGGVVVGGVGVLLDREAGGGDAGRVGERQVAGGGQRLGGRDLDLARAAAGVQLERLLGGDMRARRQPARPRPARRPGRSSLVSSPRAGVRLCGPGAGRASAHAASWPRRGRATT